jgi:polysaccharide export outer membrane protein
MKPNVFAACLLAGLALPALAASAENEAGVPAAQTTQPARGPLKEIVDDYHIGPSDLLEVSVYQVPELSRVVRVDGRGEITLPLIGQIAAGGLTGQQLEMQIAAKLKEKYLQDPQVSVFIKEFISQRVTVSGNVNRAGVFPVSGRTTLMQAIAMAGGIDKLADESDIKVIRDGHDGTRQVIDYDLEPIRKGKMVDPVLQTSDVIVVGKSTGRAALKDVTETLRDVSIFGLFF